MTTYERFDVLTALFPFIDIAHGKPRPVLVLSSASFNDEHGHVIAAMITTGTGSRWPSDYVIRDLAAAGLRHRSIARMKLFTLSFGVIGKRIGAFADTDRLAFAAVRDAIFAPSAS